MLKFISNLKNCQILSPEPVQEHPFALFAFSNVKNPVFLIGPIHANVVDENEEWKMAVKAVLVALQFAEILEAKFA
jgi:hypothetical protein